LNGDWEKHHNEKRSNSMLSAAAGLIYSVAQRVSKGDSRDDQTAETNRRIANSTVAVAYLTLGLLVMSAVTCGVLVKQWQTFEKTDQTLKAQERAFIYVDKFDFNIMPNGRTITPIWKNSGSTQATDVFTYLSWKPLEDEIPPIYGFPDLGFDGVPAKKQGYYFGTTFIGPQAVVSGISSVIDNHWMLSTRHSGFRKAIIYGWVCYKDVFGSPHITRFCNYIEDGGAKVCQQYTCADDSCNVSCE
jgi:hypothetical protein